MVVTNTPDVLTNATAELALALMLAAARRARRGGAPGASGSAGPAMGPGGALGRELSGTRHRRARAIGLRVAELLRGFEPSSTRRRAPPERSRGSAWSGCRLEELVARSDFVTLHAPLTPETRHLVDAALLARFKPGAVLVNTARGALVDAEALAGAPDGRLSAAAAWTSTSTSRRSSRSCWRSSNVVLLPHLGSATAAARDGMARLVAENVIAVLAGKAPAHAGFPLTARRSATARQGCRAAKDAKRIFVRFGRSTPAAVWTSARRWRRMRARGSLSRTPTSALGRLRAARRAARKPRCEDCFFHQNMLCALPDKKPCPTFRPAHPDGLKPPQQLSFVFRQERRDRAVPVSARTTL